MCMCIYFHTLNYNPIILDLVCYLNCSRFGHWELFSCFQYPWHILIIGNFSGEGSTFILGPMSSSIILYIPYSSPSISHFLQGALVPGSTCCYWMSFFSGPSVDKARKYTCIWNYVGINIINTINVQGISLNISLCTEFRHHGDVPTLIQYHIVHSSLLLLICNSNTKKPGCHYLPYI